MDVPSQRTIVRTNRVGRRTAQGSGNDRSAGMRTKHTVIAGELEGSWRAGGQQEGLQFNGEAAG